MLYCTIDIDDCLPSPCQHGTCQDLHNGYKCTCNHGYTGTDCETGNRMQPNEIGRKVKIKHIVIYFIASFICLNCFV
jgi:hypothetical protein